MGNVIDAVTAFQPGDAIGAALQQILASDGFCKSQRLSKLLTFLVDKKLRGAVRDTSEYVIGIDVFDRDPAIYSTCSDPIVRVQVGRLRDKLKKYYATEGAHSSLCFSIPLGSYMPEIHPVDRPAAIRPTHRMIAAKPLELLTESADGLAITRGINEELSHRLYLAFGNAIVISDWPGDMDAGSRTAFCHRLEGAVRIDGNTIRTSLRLIDQLGGHIAWSAQFDRTAPLTIGQQEELALAMCTALTAYFANAVT